MQQSVSQKEGNGAKLKSGSPDNHQFLSFLIVKGMHNASILCQRIAKGRGLACCQEEHGSQNEGNMQGFCEEALAKTNNCAPQCIVPIKRPTRNIQQEHYTLCSPAKHPDICQGIPAMTCMPVADEAMALCDYEVAPPCQAAPSSCSGACWFYRWKQVSNFCDDDLNKHLQGCTLRVDNDQAPTMENHRLCKRDARKEKYPRFFKYGCKSAPSTTCNSRV
eukprot:925641-Pelagomonas_calceolata.AAC.4